MKKPLIVAFSGKAGSGKNTAASYLVDYLKAHQKTVSISAFADPIRFMLHALDVPAEYMYRRDCKEQDIPGFGASYRHMAQTLGTEWGRQCMGSSFWVKLMDLRLQKSAVQEADFIIITDVRFQNEAQYVLDQGGLLIEVQRKDAAPVKEHASEQQTLPVGHVLFNDGSLEDLQSQCGKLFLLLASMQEQEVAA